ncbi:RodZ domain-containing protein [Cupriavidus sp. AU9028]|uniref:RodZ domain-containing protein n=1 Tax=Cupriavidus sp. AU9028 TaxID=2871157 RepID=UPI001C940BEE|nr:RodZ domain-containing protein [Cupriavidus sp. AU9028]MBY4896193.1 DUF4115 domain-containing protein [Cupriavidus sp. AU9028]
MSEYERAEGQAVSTDANGIAHEIGSSLAQARAAQGMSVEDVSARLKVPRQKIQAIEAGDVAALPDLTFAKGLMRAYARMLHIDIDALLARFHAKAAPPGPEVAIRRTGSLNESFNERRPFSTGSNSSSRGRWVWLALVLVVLAFGAVFGYDHAREWLEARQQQTPGTVVEGQGEPDPAAPAAGEPGTVTAVLPQLGGAEPATAADAASAPEAAASPTLATPLAPVPPSAGLPASEPAAAPSLATAPASAPAAAAAAATGAGELALRFAAETWYEIRDNSGKVILGGTAHAGDEVRGGGKPPYKVVIGNVKGVQSMTRDGQPVDLAAANRNNVARLTLP